MLVPVITYLQPLSFFSSFLKLVRSKKKIKIKNTVWPVTIYCKVQTISIVKTLTAEMTALRCSHWTLVPEMLDKHHLGENIKYNQFHMLLLGLCEVFTESLMPLDKHIHINLVISCVVRTTHKAVVIVN